MPRFTRAAELVSWAQEEYLSQLLLRRLAPKPGRLGSARVVTLDWGLVTSESRLTIYHARAEGVSHWTLDGGGPS